GDLSGQGEAIAFKGRLNLRGTSAVRFMTWVTGQKPSLGPKGDGPFEIRTGLSIDATQAAAPDLAGSLAGKMLTASVHHRWAGRPELVVSLEGPKLDARGLIPEGFNLSETFDQLTRAPFAKQAEGRASRAARADLDLRLKAGQLLTAARTYRDVSAMVEVKSGSLKQLQLRLAGDEGYSLELEGAVDALTSLPKGTLRGSVMAESAAGIAPLADLLGVPIAFRPGDSREKTVIPLRLAGTMTFGARTPTAADLVIEGEANEAAVRVNARFDGGTGGWRSGRSDLTASLESASTAKVAALLFATGLAGGRAEGAKPGRILIRATGVPSEGLATVASLEGGEVGLSFRGQVRLAETGARAE